MSVKRGHTPCESISKYCAGAIPAGRQEECLHHLPEAVSGWAGHGLLLTFIVRRCGTWKCGELSLVSSVLPSLSLAISALIFTLIKYFPVTLESDPTIHFSPQVK